MWNSIYAVGMKQFAISKLPRPIMPVEIYEVIFSERTLCPKIPS